MNNNQMVRAIRVMGTLFIVYVVFTFWWIRKPNDTEMEYKCLGDRVTTLETKTFENLQVVRIAQMEREIDELRGQIEEIEEFSFKLDTDHNKIKTIENKLIDAVYSENEWQWIKMGSLPMNKSMIVPFDKKFAVVTNEIDITNPTEWKYIPFGEIKADWYVRFLLPINEN